MLDEQINSLVIKTPEGISFSLPLAGPVTRFFAYAIDLAVIVAVTMVLNVLLVLFSVLGADLVGAATILSYFIISIGYGMVLEWRLRGQTLGKRVMKLRVVDDQGLRLRFNQVVIRNLLRSVDSLPALYLVGGIACLLSARSQRLGDYVANTIVVRALPLFDYDVSTVAPGKYNSFRDYPHLEARLRQKASVKEASIALQALIRRKELESEARINLMSELAKHFKALVSFPEKATLGLTDEQYVVNVVDSIYQDRGKDDARHFKENSP